MNGTRIMGTRRALEKGTQRVLTGTPSSEEGASGSGGHTRGTAQALHNTAVPTGVRLVWYGTIHRTHGVLTGYRVCVCVCVCVSVYSKGTRRALEKGTQRVLDAAEKVLRARAATRVGRSRHCTAVRGRPECTAGVVRHTYIVLTGYSRVTVVWVLTGYRSMGTHGLP
jgi:hypothetical protein